MLAHTRGDCGDMWVHSVRSGVWVQLAGGQAVHARPSADWSRAPAQGPPSDGDAFLPLWTHRPGPSGPWEQPRGHEAPSPPGRGSCCLALWSQQALGGQQAPRKPRPPPAEGNGRRGPGHCPWREPTPASPGHPVPHEPLTATISVEGKTRSHCTPVLASETTSLGAWQPSTLGFTCRPGRDSL